MQAKGKSYHSKACDSDPGGAGTMAGLQIGEFTTSRCIRHWARCRWPPDGRVWPKESSRFGVHRAPRSSSWISCPHFEDGSEKWHSRLPDSLLGQRFEPMGWPAKEASLGCLTNSSIKTLRMPASLRLCYFMNHSRNQQRPTCWLTQCRRA